MTEASLSAKRKSARFRSGSNVNRDLVEYEWSSVNKTHSPDFTQLSKAALHELADRLLHGDYQATALCVDFVCSETRGVWHGRARAMMSRRMKHVGLDEKQSARLVETITSRLASGEFSEQFKDQLRLVMRLDSATLLRVARTCRSSELPHVRSYAKWALDTMGCKAENGQEPPFANSGHLGCGLGGSQI